MPNFLLHGNVIRSRYANLSAISWKSEVMGADEVEGVNGSAKHEDLVRLLIIVSNTIQRNAHDIPSET
jgi:hypothetical protein